MASIPRSAHAIVGGSGTSAIDFPEGLADPRVRVVGPPVAADTPFGRSPEVTHVAVALPDGGERDALVAPMHAWQHGVRRSSAALALFWVFQQAGVRRVIGESGAGSITQHFRPRDLVVPHDVIDFTPQVIGHLDPAHRILMRNPFCPELRAVIWEGTQALAISRATRCFDRGILATTEGTRFETAAEVSAYARIGADLVSSGVCPDVFLAREIGACYGAMTLVLNYAEGVRPRWDYELLEEIIREDALSLGRLLIDALVQTPQTSACGCATYRKRVDSAGAAPLVMDTPVSEDIPV